MSDKNIQYTPARSLRFGDIVINHWAAPSNPLRRAIVVRVFRDTIQLTSGAGEFWETSTVNHRLEKVGNVIKGNACDNLHSAALRLGEYLSSKACVIDGFDVPDDIWCPFKAKQKKPRSGM